LAVSKGNKNKQLEETKMKTYDIQGEKVAALYNGPSERILGGEIYWDRQDPRDEGPAFRRKDDSGALELSGWAHVSGRNVEDAEVAGYNLRDYFRANGAYQGPDQDGIYPVLAAQGGAA